MTVCPETPGERLPTAAVPSARGPPLALGYDGAFVIQPDWIGGLLCAHKWYTRVGWQDGHPRGFHLSDRRPSLTDVGEQEEPS